MGGGAANQEADLAVEGPGGGNINSCPCMHPTARPHHTTHPIPTYRTTRGWECKRVCKKKQGPFKRQDAETPAHPNGNRQGQNRHVLPSRGLCHPPPTPLGLGPLRCGGMPRAGPCVWTPQGTGFPACPFCLRASHRTAPINKGRRRPSSRAPPRDPALLRQPSYSSTPFTHIQLAHTAGPLSPRPVA